MLDITREAPLGLAITREAPLGLADTQEASTSRVSYYSGSINLKGLAIMKKGFDFEARLLV